MQVYKLTNKKTGMSYIGSTTLSLGQRCAGHRQMAGRGLTYPLAEAIRVDGWDSFETTTLAFCSSKQDMYAKEIAAIALFETLHPRGYNQSLGGPGLGGREVTQDTRDKLSQAMKGRKPAKLTPAGRERMIAKRSGARNWRARAVTYQDVTYACILDLMNATGLSRGQVLNRRKAGFVLYAEPPKTQHRWGFWNKGKTASAEMRAKMSLAHRGAKNWNARAVEIDGTVYPSTVDAEAATGLTRNMIRGRIKRGEARYVSEPKRIH